MSVRPSDFLDSAKLLAQGNCEIDKRNAISRAYYAAYHRAKTVYPFRPAKGQTSHKSFFDHLMKSQLKYPARLVGSRLKTMHVHRVTADYFIQEEIFSSILNIQLDGAEEIIALLDAFEMCRGLPEQNEG